VARLSLSKPETLQEYLVWLPTAGLGALLSTLEVHYLHVTAKAKADLEKSPCWTAVCAALREWEGEYLASTGSPLLVGPGPNVLVKPWRSLLIKTFRKNVVENLRWPEPPEGGWILPGECFALINDILRAQIVVKYADAVGFLAGRLAALYNSHSLPCEVQWEARETGYYAAHVYGKPTFDLPTLTWKTVSTALSVEMQITTQLQDSIRTLLRWHYEAERVHPDPRDHGWQWDLQSEKFATCYLSHVLHYLEAAIVGIRDRQQKEVHNQ